VQVKVTAGGTKLEETLPLLFVTVQVWPVGCWVTVNSKFSVPVTGGAKIDEVPFEFTELLATTLLL
jgi:hypothetical protein